jgi:ABC-2 type transport system permease protein
MTGAAYSEQRELRAIEGPSALGGGARRFWQLVWLLGTTDFKLTYFGTALGYVWSLIRPLALFGVLLVVFTQIFDFGDDIQDYAAVLLLNVMLFTFFAETTQLAVTSVVAKEGVVRKMQFPRLAIPLSTVLTGLFNLGLNLIAVFAFVLIYGVEPLWTWALFPLVVIALAIITAAVATVLSVLYVSFRDTAIIWSVVSLMLFYGTPVLYTVEQIPDSFREVILANPLAAILAQAREWMIDPNAPGALEAVGSVPKLLVPIGVAVGICALSAWLFRRNAPKIAEEL